MNNEFNFEPLPNPANSDTVLGLSSTGGVYRTAANTYTVRTITGTANEITVGNGDGVSGAPTLSLPTALTFTGKTVTGGTFASPALTTPSLGAATATTINGYTFTNNGTATLNIANGKSLTVSNILTFTGTDSSSVAFGAGGTVLYSGGALGTPSSGTLTNCTGLPAAGVVGTAATGGGTCTGSCSGTNTGDQTLATLDTSSFFATLSSNPTDVTGDGTQYVVLWDTASRNVGSNFNTSTGIYTAPATGFYEFITVISFLQMTAATSYFIEFLVNASDYFVVNMSGSTYTTPTSSGVIMLPLNANDTVKVNVQVSGLAKIVDINKTYSFFSGRRVA